MADTETEVMANGTGGLSAEEDDERMKQRPADIDADVREMERRKRVEAIMSSKLFREELERVLDQQLHEGGGAGPLLQRITEMVGGVRLQAASNRGASCVLPINDIRGVEGMGYEKGEKILRCKLAAVYRLVDLHGWTQGGICGQITARLNTAVDQLLTAPRGILPHEVTASSLMKADMLGAVIDQGTTNFPINLSGFSVHAAVHSARPDIRCIIHVRSPAALAVSAQRAGLLPLCAEAALLGDVAYHRVPPGVLDNEQRDLMVRALGPAAKVLVLANGGALCCGETLEEAFHHAKCAAAACDVQLRLAALPPDALTLIDDDTRRQMYEESRKPPAEGGKWRVGGEELEALMRMLDNAGFRTGYIYRHPLVKGDVPKPKNDVEVPPAVSSLGYLLEEEEMYRHGLWKKGALKGGDRTRWLNSPNVYQKVEVLETGTTDPKKITKWVDANNEEWVQDGSPAHSSTPVRIDAALQFVPKGTNPKEFKKLQQQIKDNRRADKISAGPQSHILEGVTWDEANKLSEDANVTQTGDHVVLMGAASKGIIQRGYQHNATVYSAPYARNPFDNVSDTELQEYRRQVQRKQRPDYDTDLSESEAIVSGQITSPGETEEESRDEHRVLRIETKQAPKASQPEIVLSDESMSEFLNAERRAADRSFREPSALSEREAFADSSASAVSDVSVSVSVRRTSDAVVVRSYRTPAQQTVVRDANNDPINTVTHEFARPNSNPVFLTSKRAVHDFSRINNFSVIANKFDSDKYSKEKKIKQSKSYVDVRSCSNGNVSDDNSVDTLSVCSIGVQSDGTIRIKRDKIIGSNTVDKGVNVEGNTNDMYYSNSASNLKMCSSTNEIATTTRTGSSYDDFYIDCKRVRGEMTFSSKDPPKSTMSWKPNPAHIKKGSKCRMSLCDKYSNEVARTDALDVLSDKSSYSSVMSCDWDMRDFVYKTRSLPRFKRSSRPDGLYRTNSHSGLVNAYLKDPEPNHFHLPKCRSCGAFNPNYMWEVTRDKLLARRSNAPIRRYSESDNNELIINGRNNGTLPEHASKSVGEINNVRTINVTHFIVPKHKVEKVIIGGQEFVESQEFTEDCYYDDIANSFSSQNQTVIERKPEEMTSNKKSHDKFKKPVKSDSLNNMFDEFTRKHNTDVDGAPGDGKKPNNLTDHAIHGEYLKFNDELDFDSAAYESPVRDLVQKDIRNYSVPIALYCDDFKGDNKVALTSDSIIFSPSKMLKGTLEPIIEESKSSYGDESNSFESDKDKKGKVTDAILEKKLSEKVSDHCNDSDNYVELKNGDTKMSLVDEKYIDQDKADDSGLLPQDVQESTNYSVPKYSSDSSKISMDNSNLKVCDDSDQINDKLVKNTMAKIYESLPVRCEGNLMTISSLDDQSSRVSSTSEFERIEVAVEVVNDVLDRLSFQEYINTTDGFENVEAASDVMNCLLKRLSCDYNHNYCFGLRNGVTDNTGSRAPKCNNSDLENSAQDFKTNNTHDNEDTGQNLFEYIRLILSTLVNYAFEWIDKKCCTNEFVKTRAQNEILDIQRSNSVNYCMEQKNDTDLCTFLGSINMNLTQKIIADKNVKIHRIELSEEELQLSVFEIENRQKNDQPPENAGKRNDVIMNADQHKLDHHVKLNESSITNCNHNQPITSEWTKNNENIVEELKHFSASCTENMNTSQNNEPYNDIDVSEEQLPDTVRSVVNFVISQPNSLHYADATNNTYIDDKNSKDSNCHFNDKQLGKSPKNVYNKNYKNNLDEFDVQIPDDNINNSNDMKKLCEQKDVFKEKSKTHDEFFDAVAEKEATDKFDDCYESISNEKISTFKEINQLNNEIDGDKTSSFHIDTKMTDRFVAGSEKTLDHKFNAIHDIDKKVTEGDIYNETDQNYTYDTVPSDNAFSRINELNKLLIKETVCVQHKKEYYQTNICDVVICDDQIGNVDDSNRLPYENSEEITERVTVNAVDQFNAATTEIQRFDGNNQLQDENRLQDTCSENLRTYDKQYGNDEAACNDQVIIPDIINIEHDKNPFEEFSSEDNCHESRTLNNKGCSDNIDYLASKEVDECAERSSNGDLDISHTINIVVKTSTVNAYSDSTGKITDSDINVSFEGDSESASQFFESKSEIIKTEDFYSEILKGECSLDETKPNGRPQDVNNKCQASLADIEKQTIQELDDILNKTYDENDLSDVATQNSKDVSANYSELEKNKSCNGLNTAYHDVFEKENDKDDNDVMFEANYSLDNNIHVGKQIFDDILDKTFSNSAQSCDLKANNRISEFDKIYDTSKLSSKTEIITNQEMNAEYRFHDRFSRSEATTADNIKDLSDDMNLAFLEDSILLRSIEETNISDSLHEIQNVTLLNNSESDDCLFKTTSSPINRHYLLRNDPDNSLIASPIEVSQKTFKKNLFKTLEKKTESKSSPSINKSAIFAMSQIEQPGGLKFWISFDDDTSIYNNDRKYDTFPISRKCKTGGNLENKTPSFLNVSFFDELKNINQKLVTDDSNCMKHTLVRNTRSVSEIPMNNIYFDAEESLHRKECIAKENDIAKENNIAKENDIAKENNINLVLNKDTSIENKHNSLLTNESINSLKVNLSGPSSSTNKSQINFKHNNEINNNCVSEAAYDPLDISEAEMSGILNGDMNLSRQLHGYESEISVHNHSSLRTISSLTVETCNVSYLNDDSNLTAGSSNHNISVISISDDSLNNDILVEHEPKDIDSSENNSIDTPTFHNIPMSEIYSPLTTTPTHWGKFELETNYYERRSILCQGLLGKPDSYSYTDLNESIDQLSYESCGSKSESFTSCTNSCLTRDAYVYGKNDRLSDTSLAAANIETLNTSLAAANIETLNSNEKKDQQIDSVEEDSYDDNIENRNLTINGTSDNVTISDDVSSEVTCTTVVTVINAKTKLLFDSSKIHPSLKEINYRRNAYSWPSLDHALYYTIPTHFQKSESLEIEM